MVFGLLASWPPELNFLASSNMNNFESFWPLWCFFVVQTNCFRYQIDGWMIVVIFYVLQKVAFEDENIIAFKSKKTHLELCWCWLRSCIFNHHVKWWRTHLEAGLLFRWLGFVSRLGWLPTHMVTAMVRGVSICQLLFVVSILK